MVKRWAVSELGIEEPVVFTEEQILESYWDYWKHKMQSVGKYDEINRENCIRDWVVVNWAWEYDE